MSGSAAPLAAPRDVRAPRAARLGVAGAGALLALLAALSTRTDAGPVVPLLAVLGLLLFLPHVVAALEGRWTAFHPLVIFTAFCFFGYFLRSMHLVWHEKLNLYHILVDRPTALDLLARGLLVVILGVCGFYLGYASPQAASLGARLPVPRSRWSVRRVRALSLLFTTIGAASYAAYAHAAGGLIFLATNMELRSELSAGMHLYFFGIRFLELGLLFRYVGHLRGRAGRLRRFSLAIHALAVMVAVGLLGSRAWAMEVLFMMLVVRAAMLRPPRLRTLAIVVASGLFLFSVYDQYRNLTHHGFRASEAKEISVGSATAVYDGVLGGRNFDMMDNLLSVLWYTPDRLPFLLGSSYLHFFVNFVPRGLWPGKPKGIDSILAEKIYGWAMGGAPPGTIGELYFNFQFAGVVVGMALFGALVRVAWTYSKRERRHPFLALFLGATLVFVGMVTRGSFFQVGSTWAMRIVPIFLGSLLVRAGRPHGGTRPREATSR
ncbi:MAG: O-antigen polymerase [bacterium]